MKTYSPKKGEVDRNWYVVDASDQTVGRLCTHVARLLAGKHKHKISRFCLQELSPF